MALETARLVGTKVLAVCVPSVLKNDFEADEFDCGIFPISRVIRTTFAADTNPESVSDQGLAMSSSQVRGPVAGVVEGRYGVRKVGPLFVPAAMPDEEG